MKLRTFRRPAIVVTAAVLVAVGMAGGAVAKDLITGADIKDGSITGKDIATNSIGYGDIGEDQVRANELAPKAVTATELADNAVLSAKIKDGSIVLADLAGNSVDSSKVLDGSIALADLKVASVDGSKIVDGSLTLADLADGVVGDIRNGVFVGEHWGVLNRNISGAASAAVRSGPYTGTLDPVLGTGSLQIDTVAGSKVDFGNERDFLGADLDELFTGPLGFSFLTTGENEKKGDKNTPVLRLEIDPNLDNSASNYTSLVFSPNAEPSQSEWNVVNAKSADAGFWFMTGAAGDASGCNLTTTCTYDQVMAKLGAAKVGSVSLGKGTDYEFHGAVDALKLGGKVYDFEARGVIARDAS
jgi:hypothetical protein